MDHPIDRMRQIYRNEYRPSNGKQVVGVGAPFYFDIKKDEHESSVQWYVSLNLNLILFSHSLWIMEILHLES